MLGVRAIVASALERARVEATFCSYATHHNPIRFHASAVDAEQALAGHTVSFPAFDLQLFRQPGFEQVWMR